MKSNLRDAIAAYILLAFVRVASVINTVRGWFRREKRQRF